MLPETSVLDAALSVRHELPYSCKGGMCASCKARLVDGTVEMAKNYALVDADLDAGFILTCQSIPPATGSRSTTTSADEVEQARASLPPRCSAG